jgi:hypothetical protein
VKVTPTTIPDLLILEPRVFGDDRGFFFESFNARRFAELTGVETAFVQDNHSRSARGSGRVAMGSAFFGGVTERKSLESVCVFCRRVRPWPRGTRALGVAETSRVPPLMITRAFSADRKVK